MTGFASWQALYQSDLQGVWAVSVAPFFLFVLVALRRAPRLGVVPAAAPFVRAYVLVFAIETILDPFVGGPLLRWLGLGGGAFATAVMVAFVILGDFRVLLLVFALAAWKPGGPAPPQARSIRTAALASFLVPVTAVIVDGALGAIAGPLPAQTIWLVYELAFLTFALVLRAAVLPADAPAAGGPRRAFLRAVLGYVAVYYALWATADLLILGTGRDVAWALRIVPNQLYYAWYLPFVYWRFFARRYSATSTSTHASR